MFTAAYGAATAGSGFTYEYFRNLLERLSRSPGYHYTSTLLDLLLQAGVDRLLFPADHPNGSMALARAFLDQLPMSAADRERIADGDAERLPGT